MSELTKLYKKHCKEVDEIADKSKRKFLSELVKNHAFYEKGQIIDDGKFRIQVDKIKFSVMYGDVNIVYCGKEFTKKNQPKKSKDIAYIYTDEKHERIKIIDHARLV